jgi:hypothetical protein
MNDEIDRAASDCCWLCFVAGSLFGGLVSILVLELVK